MVTRIILYILYVLAGISLAAPYCLLAGWSTEDFPLVIFLAPVYVFIWFIIATFSGVIDHGHRQIIRFNWRVAFGKEKRERLFGSLAGFWVWTLYSLLPIILHWGARLLTEIGYETIGSLIDTHRYASPLYLFIATLALIFLAMIVKGVWEAIKNTWVRFVH